MKEAPGAGRWKIHPGLTSDPSLEAGASWKATDEERREG